MNEFSATRDLLGRIRTTLGDKGLVALAWDGTILRLTYSIIESGKPMFIANFDDPQVDYAEDADRIIAEFVRMSAAHFDAPSEPSAILAMCGELK